MSVINGSPNIPSGIANDEAKTEQAIIILKEFIKAVNDNGVNKLYVDELLRNLYIQPITESVIINKSHKIERVLLSSSSITVTLDGFQPGDSIFIIDELGLSETHNITVNLNGYTANGSTDNIVIAREFGYIELYCTSNDTFIIVREKLT